MNPCGLGSLLGHAFSVFFLQTPRYFWLYGVRFICGLCPKQFSFCQVFYRSWFFAQLSRSKYAPFAWASELSCRTLKWCMADLNIFNGGYMLKMKESPRDGGWAQPMVSSSYLVPLRSGGLGVPSQEDRPGQTRLPSYSYTSGILWPDQATIPRSWYDHVPEWKKNKKRNSGFAHTFLKVRRITYLQTTSNNPHTTATPLISNWLLAARLWVACRRWCKRLRGVRCETVHENSGRNAAYGNGWNWYMFQIVQVLFDLKVEQECFIMKVWFQEAILQLHSWCPIEGTDGTRMGEVRLSIEHGIEHLSI